MTTMSKRLRKLWEASERVALMRLAQNKTELSTALTVRNDAVLSVELAFSALRKENERLKALVEKLDRFYDTCDEDGSIAEQDADSAGYPGISGYIGRTPGDDGRRMIALMDADAMGEIECAYLHTVEPEI